MKEIGKEKKLAIAALIVAVLMLTIAFAAMSRTLKINGTAKVDSAAWDIHFKSASMTDKKGDARQVAEPVIDNGGIDLTLKVGLRKPKDEITYEAIIINEGDIDAEIESIEYPNLTEEQAKIIEFEATYADGTEISKSQELKATEEKTVKIVIRYKDITDESLLATEAYDIPLTFKINYIQKGFNTENIPEGGEIVDDTSKAVLANPNVEETMQMQDPSQATFYNSSIKRNQVESLTFSKTSGSAREGSTWDASAAGDGSIIAYYTDSDSNGLYEVVIESESNIYAPVDSTGLFAAFTSLKELNFNNFKTNDATTMQGMFAMTTVTNLDLSTFDTSNVTNMNTMFFNTSFESLDLTNFNTSNVTDMSYMFAMCTSLTNLDLTSLDTSKVTNMAGMFYASSSLVTIDMSNLDTSNVTNMSNMFAALKDENMNLQQIYLTDWNTTKVTDMSSMFYGCSAITNIDLSSLDTLNVTTMHSMFKNCAGLINLDLSSFDTLNVTDMGDMFSDCEELETINLSSFNTTNVTNMSNMFSDCSSLTSLDLSNFITSNLTGMQGMFYHCNSLTELKLISAEFNNPTANNAFNFESNPIIYVKDEEAKRFIENLNSTVNVIIEPLQS